MKDRIEAVVFDLYGTLLYLAEESRSYAKLFFSIGLQTPEELSKARRICMTEDFDNLSELVERIKPNLRIDFQIYQDEVEKERASAALYPETKEVLERLRERNIKLGLISNLASPYKKPFFDLGLNAYFDGVLFSCDAGLRKPDPEIYQMMIETIKIDPAYVLMTGDKIHTDVDGPKSAGMKAVHLNRKDKSADSIETLREIFQYL